MPVLPLVGSTSVPPGFSAPVRSASSIIASAMRSLTLPPGLRDSTLAATAAPPGLGSLRRRTSGVPPISSSTEAWIVMGPSIYMLASDGRAPAPRRPAARTSSDVVHGPRAAAALARTRDQLTERDAIVHLRHRLGDLQPEVREVR